MFCWQRVLGAKVNLQLRAMLQCLLTAATETDGQVRKVGDPVEVLFSIKITILKSY